MPVYTMFEFDAKDWLEAEPKEPVDESHICENCGTPDATPVRAGTMYPPVQRSAAERLLRDDAEPFDPPEDPNPPRNFCSVCEAEYNDYWNERWAEYRSGCL